MKATIKIDFGCLSIKPSKGKSFSLNEIDASLTVFKDGRKCVIRAVGTKEGGGGHGEGTWNESTYGYIFHDDLTVKVVSYGDIIQLKKIKC